MGHVTDTGHEPETGNGGTKGAIGRLARSAEDSVYFRLTGRLAIMACTIILGVMSSRAWWLLDTISDHSIKLTQQTEQLAALKQTVSNNYDSNHELLIALGRGLDKINDLITTNAPKRYTKDDALIDRAAVGLRIEGIERRLDRDESKIDGIQSDLSAIQRASEVPLGKRK